MAKRDLSWLKPGATAWHVKGGSVRPVKLVDESAWPGQWKADFTDTPLMRFYPTTKNLFPTEREACEEAARRLVAAADASFVSWTRNKHAASAMRERARKLAEDTNANH